LGDAIFLSCPFSHLWGPLGRSSFTQNESLPHMSSHSPPHRTALDPQDLSSPFTFSLERPWDPGFEPLVAESIQGDKVGFCTTWPQLNHPPVSVSLCVISIYWEATSYLEIQELHLVLVLVDLRDKGWVTKRAAPGHGWFLSTGNIVSLN
jgi:hypothetical protein